MKNLFITLVLLSWGVMTSWAQTDYKQWETHRFTVKMGHEADFEKGLAAHNKKYHTADPFKTGIFDIHTGPNSGQVELSMGPMTFTQMEGRPDSPEHNADWAMVMSHVESAGESMYWRADKEIEYAPAGSENFTALRWRYFTIRPGQSDRFEGLLKQVLAVYKAKNYGAGYRVYWRWGASQGPHACAEMSMSSWAFYDQPNTYEKDFEEVNGEGSYDRFVEELDLCLDRTKTYDELVKYRPDLSSN